MKRTYHPESGNALWFILLAVVLLTALSMTLSKSSETTEQTGAYERAQVEASDVLRYAASMEQAVGGLRMKDISENQISFASADIAGYGTPGTTPTAEIFHARGAGLTYRRPSSAINGGVDWVFTGGNSVPGVGSDGTGATSSTDNELMMILPNISVSLCTRINAELGLTGAIPQDATNMDIATPYTGTFPNGFVIENTNSRKSACVQGFQDGGGTSIAGRYYFYHVLIAR